MTGGPALLQGLRRRRRMIEGAPGRSAAYLMEVAMRKHREFDDLPCFRDHA
jgi:hypothetical protein